MIFLTIAVENPWGHPQSSPGSISTGKYALHHRSEPRGFQGGLTALGYFCHKFSGEVMGSYSESE